MINVSLIYQQIYQSSLLSLLLQQSQEYWYRPKKPDEELAVQQLRQREIHQPPQPPTLKWTQHTFLPHIHTHTDNIITVV